MGTSKDPAGPSQQQSQRESIQFIEGLTKDVDSLYV